MSTDTKASIPQLTQELINSIRLIEINRRGRSLDNVLSDSIDFVIQARDKLVAAQAEEVTDEMIDDILCAAFEGGSNYWITKVYVRGSWPKGASFASECVSKGATLVLTEDCGEGDPPRERTLTREKIAFGIRTEAARMGKTVEAFYENHDASDADCALQWAVLGELVYG